MFKKVYLKNFGWPMGVVKYDYHAVFEQDLVMGDCGEDISYV